MIRLGLVGFGFWGPLLARNVHAHAGMGLAAVCDADPGRRAEAQRLFPGARVFARAPELLTDPHLDAVAIAVPAVMHFQMALDGLRAGKHVFVEKPLATSLDEAERLVDEATRRDLVLMVDHTFLFSSAVRRLATLVAEGTLGALRYYDSTRTALGRFAGDVNVLWDLAVHDLAVLDRLIAEPPLAIAAHGAAHGPGPGSDVAFVTARYSGDLLAHLHVNRIAPVKLRRTLVGGSRGAALWDDLEPVEKLRVFHGGRLDRRQRGGRASAPRRISRRRRLVAASRGA